MSERDAVAGASARLGLARAVSLISESPRIAANRRESPRIAANRHESAVFAQHTSFFHACVRLRMVRLCEVPNFRSIFQS